MWERLNFVGMRVGALYVDVDLADPEQLAALRAQVRVMCWLLSMHTTCM